MTPTSDSVRFLRTLAFEIHRKRPADEALAECIGKDGRGGRHRQFRQAAALLESDGFVAALQAADMLGDEAAVLLEAIIAAADHRLLAAALGKLADHHEKIIREQG